MDFVQHFFCCWKKSALSKNTGQFWQCLNINLFQQGFWQPSFCRKHHLWSLCCDGRTKVGFRCSPGTEKRKCRDRSMFIDPSFSRHSLSSRKTMTRIITLVPPSQQRLHKSQFLQKLSCQKSYWDQARLSSLVNKQVAQIWTDLFTGYLLLPDRGQFLSLLSSWVSFGQDKISRIKIMLVGIPIIFPKRAYKLSLLGRYSMQVVPIGWGLANLCYVQNFTDVTLV